MREADLSLAAIPVGKSARSARQEEYSWAAIARPNGLGTKATRANTPTTISSFFRG